jgi:hypothetical protein
MRTGSVGNRNAEDMVNTLPKEKRETITSVRKKLLEKGYLENLEYDSINIEPVLIYSKSEKNTIFVRHKWATLAEIPVTEETQGSLTPELYELLVKDDDGKSLLRLQLPDQEKMLLQILDGTLLS